MVTAMERTLFKFIVRYSKRDQILIAPLVVASMVVYFLSLDLPKTIINEAIQGDSFSGPDSTAVFMRIAFKLPDFLGGNVIQLFDGLELERLPYLFALSTVFLVLIVVNGALKFKINTMKGWLGERMLRRLRFQLYDHILRFPLQRFRHVKSAEMATMVKDEVEPLGGFVGESIITPFFLGGQVVTALFFIVYQHLMLGLVTLGVVGIQAVLIPKLRRRLLELAKQRQLGARRLAGRIGESVDGIFEIHANDTSNYERAELSARLGNLFRIRFEFYQRKFLIKFLNNFLSQLTPFLFYSFGGYLVIVGHLDIGALVAVIAAYKDLPSPVKELIDWDQQRLDAEIKFSQVVEQFTIDDLAPPALQEPIEAPTLPQQGKLQVSNLSWTDEAGLKVIDGVTFEIDSATHVAVIGSHASGHAELTQLIAGLMPPSGGTIELGGVDLVRAPEAVTGRALAYVGPGSFLFPSTVRENLVYGLRHFPLRAARYEGEALAESRFQLAEAERTGNILLDFNAEWIDYASAGASGPEELEQRMLEVLRHVDLEERVFELGLHSALSPAQVESVADSVLRARESMRTQLVETGMEDLVERFDPDAYNGNATLAENLLFGTPVGNTFELENLAGNKYVQQVMAATGLAADMLTKGHKLAETMVELFSELPAGHEFFERFSFINHDDLPHFNAILARTRDTGLTRLAESERQLLLALTFKLVPARHRLGLIDEPFQARVLEARRHFAHHLPESLRSAVEFFDPEKYNRAASLQDNVLFGKIATSHAHAASRIGKMLREVLEQLSLRGLVARSGLDYQVGVGGSHLAMSDRQKLAIARALLRRPALLVLDQAGSAMDSMSHARVLKGVLGYRKGQGVLWALHRNELASNFEYVLMLERGELAAHGAFDELEGGAGVMQRLRADELRRNEADLTPV